MEDTYNIKAIILNRQARGECDGRVVVYAREAGKLELTARGAKKIKSKLAGHLEPLNLVDIMVVRGQRHDYVGAAVSERCFSEIKNDLAKLAAAGRAVGVINLAIKPGVADKEIFGLFKEYLEALECVKDNFELLTQFFILKFLVFLGHKPELSACLKCGTKIRPGKNQFGLAQGGLICAKCADLKNASQPAISDDAIKLLRLALAHNFQQLGKIKISKKLGREAGEIIDKFYRYGF
jgi:DNA repair protein RecO (recombination protein O)